MVVAQRMKQFTILVVEVAYRTELDTDVVKYVLGELAVRTCVYVIVVGVGRRLLLTAYEVPIVDTDTCVRVVTALVLYVCVLSSTLIATAETTVCGCVAVALESVKYAFAPRKPVLVLIQVE